MKKIICLLTLSISFLAFTSIEPSSTYQQNDVYVYGVSPDKRTILQHRMTTNTWTKVGGSGSDWVWANGKLYGLRTDKSGVHEYSGTGQSWGKIGGPADEIFGGRYLCATNPRSGDIHMYKNNDWTKIGGPGSDWVWANGKLYGLRTDKSGIHEYSGSGQSWEKIGGPADKIFGGRYLCATNPSSGDVYMYKNNGWTKIGTDAADLTWAGGKLYKLSSSRDVIHEYTGSGRSWRELEGGSSSKIFGGRYLCKTNLYSGDVSIYRNSEWIRIGGPGAKFIVKD